MAMPSHLISEDMYCEAKRLCSDFMGGTWMEVEEEEDFKVSRVHGGLSNTMYLCELSPSVKMKKDEPRKVLLRMYGQIIQENPETVVTDSVIYGLLAEKGMGPKLYGVFTNGRVEEFVPNRKLLCQDLHRKEISVECARVMAQFHQLKMPLMKNPDWLMNTLTRYLDEAQNNISFHHSNESQNAQLRQVLSYNLPAEFCKLKKLLCKVHSPIVFCHNDLQEGNILLIEWNGAEMITQLEIPERGFLKPIDFEYASYNFRGFDIGNHFCEWCYDYNVSEPPYFLANLNSFPSREQQLVFIQAYLAEIGSEAVTEEEHLLKEVAFFTMASDFFWALWSIIQHQISSIKFGYLEYALVRLEAYFLHKRIVEENYLSTT